MIKIEMKGLDEFARRLERMARDVQATTTQLNRTVVDTPLAPDENGFVDRSCPSCSFLFKIAADNPLNKVRACPSCGHRYPDARWETPAQLERATANAREHVTTAMHAAFSGFHPARYAVGHRSGAASEGGVNVMRDGRWVVVGLPAHASAALRSERPGADGGCRFSFIGAAFFWPGCGAASAEGNFAQSIAEIRRAIAYCRVLHETRPPDEAAIIERAILEKAMADLVTGFQMIAEVLYEQRTGVSPPQNAFQRLEGNHSGDALWCAASGRSYVDYLGAGDLARLRTYFQRRHLLAHKNGFVEQVYLDRSGDTAYAIGQRLVVRAAEVEDLTRLVETLVTAMRET